MRESYFKNSLYKLILDKGHNCKKSCEVKEFQTELKRQKDSKKYYPTPLLIELKYKTPSSSPLRVCKPYKTIYEENWVVSWVMLIGMVGGTFGLFVGFSFMEVLNQMNGALVKCNILSTCCQNGNTVLKESFKNVNGVLIYTSLLLSAIAFSAISIQDYIKERKGYSVSQEDLSPDDLPALTICWKLKYATRKSDAKFAYLTLNPLTYSKDFFINATVLEKVSDTIDFKENKFTPTVLGLNIQLSELRLEEMTNGDHKQCFQIAIEWNGQDQVSGESGRTHGILDKQTDVKINSVTEYRNLEYTCSDESYHQCLARRFENADFSDYWNKTINGTKCQYENICAPFSLPQIGKDQLSPCQNRIDRECFTYVLDKLRLNQDYYCKRLCIVKEYKFQPIKGYDKKFVLRYYFGQPYASRNIRSWKPVKTIKTEYLYVTMKSLIGSIGGTIGMFVGFSFVDVSEWFTEFLFKFWRAKVI